MLEKRASGILLHVTSLPSPFGIGVLGSETKKWIDQLKKANVTYWQVLPLSMQGAFHSPYSSISAFAGNTWLIDPRELQKEGLLTKEEVEASVADHQFTYQVGFDFVKTNSNDYLHRAFKRMNKEQKEKLDTFIKQEKDWLCDFARYTVLKEKFDHKPWWLWHDRDLRMHEKNAISTFENKYQTEIYFIYFSQWLFFSQWKNIKSYANQNGIRILGDIPLYVNVDSCDVWANPEIFQLDEKHLPIEVGGVPPDYFSEDGQLWGTPLYDWNYLKKTNYEWWLKRIEANLTIFDRIRIDHFRGLYDYWAVKASEKTARIGQWKKGPGLDFIHTMEKVFGLDKFIAEDLGDVTKEVVSFVKASRIPGMKVFEFSFRKDGSDQDLPHQFIPNLVVYTGTHDNQTLLGWLMSITKEERSYVFDYVGFEHKEKWLDQPYLKQALWSIIRCLWQSVAKLIIVPVQDLLGYGDDTRMNTPGVAEGNWGFRLDEHQLSSVDVKSLAKLNYLYKRGQNLLNI